MNDRLDPETVKALAGDRRRACAALVHYLNDSFDGVQAVMEDAKDADRVGPWVLMILDVFESVLPELRTPLGQQLLHRHITRMAGMEEA